MASLFSFSPLRHRFCGSIGTEDEGEAASRCAMTLVTGRNVTLGSGVVVKLKGFEIFKTYNGTIF